MSNADNELRRAAQLFGVNSREWWDTALRIARENLAKDDAVDDAAEETEKQPADYREICCIPEELPEGIGPRGWLNP